jgi:molybdopterin-guanine dinucleotide biosynthesis protein B
LAKGLSNSLYLQSKISNQQSAISNQQSAIKNQQSASSYKKNDFYYKKVLCVSKTKSSIAMNIRAMSFVGFHNSGKTTLIVRLAGHLRKKGLRVGIIKSARHSFELGDTGKLAATGCSIAGVAPAQTMLLFPRPLSVTSLVPLLDADILLVEGGKSLTFLPRIVLPKTQEEMAALEAGLAYGYWGEDLQGGFARLSDLGALASLVLEKGFLLPALDCGECRQESCAGLARDIVAGKALPEDCRARPAQLQVLVNGVPLGMNPFVSSILTSTIRGMLKPLKGYAPGRIEIRVEEP